MIKISRYHFSIVLFFHYQHSGIGRYTFFSARKAEFLRGSGLDGDVVLVYAHHSGKRALHFGNMCFQLRTFGTDGGINVAHRITFGSYQFYCFFQQNLAVYVLELTGSIGKMIADVAHIRRTQQCVTDSMNEHIRIRMPQQSLFMSQANAA